MYNRREALKASALLGLTGIMVVGCGDSSENNLTNLINAGIARMSGVTGSSITVKSGKTLLGSPKATITGKITYEDTIDNLENAHKRSVRYIAVTVSSYIKSDKGAISVEGTAKENTINTIDWNEGKPYPISTAKELSK